MKLVYIAGPISADNVWEREKNIRRAEELCIDVFRAGAMFICPHTMGRFFGETLFEYEKILEADLEVVKRCDAILVVTETEGWQTSAGTQGEIDFARKIGIPVFFNMIRLRKWINEQK